MKKIFYIGAIIFLIAGVILFGVGNILNYYKYNNLGSQFIQSSVIPFLFGLGIYTPLPFIEEKKK